MFYSRERKRESKFVSLGELFSRTFCALIGISVPICGRPATLWPGKADVMITMEPLSVGRTITGILFDVLAEVPGLKQNDFIRAAVRAKTNCTISRLLNSNLSMSAKLDNSANRSTPKVRRPLDNLKVSKIKKQSIGRSSPKSHEFPYSHAA
jgi:hypothetical protein